MRESIFQNSSPEGTTARTLIGYGVARALLIGSLALLYWTGYVFAFRDHNVRPVHVPSKSEQPKEAAGGIDQPPSGSTVLADERIEVESVLLTRFGFEPKEIVRSKGQFLLAVTNHGEVGDIQLYLNTAGGNLLHQQLVSLERPFWLDAFTLEPGEYQLGEVNHPKWVCRIKITGN